MITGNVVNIKYVFQSLWDQMFYEVTIVMDDGRTLVLPKVKTLISGNVCIFKVKWFFCREYWDMEPTGE